MAVQIRETVKKYENARNQEEADAFMNEFLKEGQTVIQDMIKETLRRGHDCNRFPPMFTLNQYLMSLKTA